MTVRRTFVGVLFDQLASAGRGTFGKLDRCVTRTCGFFALEPDEPTRRKWRNMAFRYLRCTGYLDVATTGSSTLWAAAPSALVQRAESDFVLIGDTAAAALLSRSVPEEHASVIAGAGTALVHAGIPFYPDLLRVSLPPLNVTRIAERAGLAVTLRYQERLAVCLPSLDSVLRAVLAADASAGALEPGGSERFNLELGAWDAYNEPRPFEPGLYRRTFRHSQPEYLLAAEGTASKLEVFRLLSPEWALVAVMATLRKELTVRYYRQSQSLTVSRNHEATARLPTLVERLLRSGTLLNPMLTGDSFTYSGLTSKTIERVRRLLPFAKVEARE